MIVIIVLSFLSIKNNLPPNKKYSKLQEKTWYKIENELKNKKFTSAFILNSQKINSFNHNLNIPLWNIRYFSTSYYPVPLSIFDLPSPDNFIEQSIHKKKQVKSEFFRFTLNQNLSHNIDSAKLLFLKQQEVDYLFVQKGNRWFPENKRKLPVSDSILFEAESFDIFKLEW
jgi:hypothetical protein